MRILMISRATLFSTPGGDTIQVEATAKYIRRLGIEVDIRLANDINIDYRAYDLLHFFNLIRPNDFMYHIKRSRLPYVLSTIYVDYSEYEKRIRKGVAGIVARTAGKFLTEYLKTVGRSIVNGEAIMSKKFYLLGQKRSMQYVLDQASYLLPNSASELNRIKTDLKVTSNYAFIPNAIDTEKFSGAIGGNDREGVLCVARIEGLKNQLNLIRAMEGTGISLTIIGKAAPNHKKYYEACRQAAGKNVRFVDHIKQEDLVSYYTKARVHILPSWFETTGLSSLEAAYLGCNPVITHKGDASEYFGAEATYCDPADVDSIRNAIQVAYELTYPTRLRDRIKKEFTWQVTAEKTAKVYKEVLQKIHQ